MGWVVGCLAWVLAIFRGFECMVGLGAGAVGGWFGVLIRFSGCDLGFGAGRWGGVYVGCG